MDSEKEELEKKELEKKELEKEELKIVDRRRFDSEGKERSTGEDSERSKDSSKMTDANINDSSSDLPAIDFSSFAMSFATQALMQLGEIAPPAGVSIPKDILAAKQTIDILTMLESKTKGNLDQRESTLIQDILHNLRITFVKVSAGKKG